MTQAGARPPAAGARPAPAGCPVRASAREPLAHRGRTASAASRSRARSRRWAMAESGRRTARILSGAVRPGV